MKKITLALFSLLFAVSLPACALSAAETESKETDAFTDGAESLDGTSAETDNENTDAVSESCVVYFSGTGNTRSIAEMIAEVTDSDLYEIVPVEIYTDDDLNYNDDDCRANMEQDDPNARPAIENDLSAVTEYKTIYLGHPIWWGTNPRIIQTFLDTYDLENARIYTFCTSGGSGIEQSISDLRTDYPNLNIISGKRLNNASEKDIEEWIDSLK